MLFRSKILRKGDTWEYPLPGSEAWKASTKSAVTTVGPAMPTGLVHLDCCRSEIKDCCVGSRGRGPFLQRCRSGLEYCFVVIHPEANGCGGTGRLLPLSKRSRPNSRGCSARTGLRGKDDGAVASCLSTHRIESRLEGSSTR